MKNILVHNFTRLGDLLQSTPLLIGLKARDPGCEITLAVHQRFQEVCRGFPFVDAVISFDSEGLKEAVLQEGDGLLQGYRYVKSYVELLKARRFDAVFNLSHSRASCLLMALLDIPHVRGSVVDRMGALSTLHPWANYFKNMSVNRSLSAFNLVDVYRRIGDVPPGPRRLVYEVPSSAHAAAESLLQGMGVQAGTSCPSPPLIAFQPGASQDSRQWPAAAFASLGNALCTEIGAQIIVVGTQAEAPLGDAIVKACRGRAISVMGHTSVATLAALLQRCRLLVTNDTGTMHVACAVGTQVVALFMGPALFYQTGPYGEGHVVLQAEIPCAPCNYLLHCSHQVCKESVGWEAVFHTVRWLLEDTPSQPPALGAGVGGYISGFDADGYLHFVPFAKAQLDRVTLLRLSYREAWKVLLDGKPLEQASAAVNREIQDHYHGEGGREAIAEIPDEVLPAFEQLHALARQGIACSQALLQEATRQPCSVERLHALSQALGALDEQIRVLGATGDGLRPLTAMFRFGKENLQGWELLPLAQQTLSLYETLAQQTEVTSRVLAAIDIGGRHATDIHRWAGVHSRS